MPKKRTYELAGFGERLAQLRKRAGYTQVELAEELGTCNFPQSQRTNPLI